MPDMPEDAPTTLEDYRVRMGDGRVILFLAGRRYDGAVELVEVGVTVDQARKIAADLTERAERADWP